MEHMRSVRGGAVEGAHDDGAVAAADVAVDGDWQKGCSCGTEDAFDAQNLTCPSWARCAYHQQK